MLQLVGTYAGTDVENVAATADYEAFTSRTIRLMTDGGRTEYVRVSRDFFGTLPEPGHQVVLGVWPRPYVRKDEGKLGCGFIAYRVVQPVAVSAVS